MMRAVVIALGYDKTLVVAHDIGNMVAYAYAATYSDKVERLVVMDAPIPGGNAGWICAVHCVFPGCKGQ